jgi:transposase-like protein
MPWKETCQMDERTQFIARVLAGEDAMTALCRGYGISRKTGYKWLARYRC